MSTVDVKTIAGEAEKVVEAIVKVEPIVSTMATFIPGAAPIMAVVHPAVVMLAPFVEKALHELAAGHNGDAYSAFIELLQHISKGRPNSPLLSGNTGVAGGFQGGSHDASAQGSG